MSSHHGEHDLEVQELPTRANGQREFLITSQVLDMGGWTASDLHHAIDGVQAFPYRQHAAGAALFLYLPADVEADGVLAEVKAYILNNQPPLNQKKS